MKKSKFTESQILETLQEAESGVPVAEVCRKRGISVATFYQWKRKYAGMTVSELKRVKELEAAADEAEGACLEANAAIQNIVLEGVPAGGEEDYEVLRRVGEPRDFAAARANGIETLLTRLNAARAAHPALRQLRDIWFHGTSDDSLIAYSKHVDAAHSPMGEDDVVLTVINLDPHRAREGEVYLNLEALGLPPGTDGSHPVLRVTDELSPRSLTEAAELLMYRTVQEGLTNALRHSRARTVDILAAASSDGLLISVANDIPADRRQAVPQALVGEDDGASAGFGVSGLSERAAEMGGRVTAGRIGDSFLLTLMLPYRQLATPLRPEAS